MPRPTAPLEAPARATLAIPTMRGGCGRRRTLLKFKAVDKFGNTKGSF
jgi:hypothetical protein